MIKADKLVLALFFGTLYYGCSGTNEKILTTTTPCRDTIAPVIYDCEPAQNGDYSFRTIPSQKLSVKLIPNMETREKLGMKKIEGVIGIHEFLLDHDLTSGFVHRYTKIMFNKLKQEDFVLKYRADSLIKMQGEISFIHKKDLTEKDTLGRNIGFFRQWRLSEIDYTEKDNRIYIKMDTCKYYTICVCPSAKPNSGRPMQIPLWHKGLAGYQPLDDFSVFGMEDGGTVVIVWENGNKILFQDIHSSWKEILETAIDISQKYKTDPAICISDSGPFSRKIKADKNFALNTSAIDAIEPYGKRFGAGYGYIPLKK